MVYIVNEVKNEAGEHIVHMYLHSACCKMHKFFIEDKPKHFIDAETRMEVDEGMRDTILNCRRHNIVWKM